MRTQQMQLHTPNGLMVADALVDVLAAMRWTVFSKMKIMSDKLPFSIPRWIGLEVVSRQHPRSLSERKLTGMMIEKVDRIPDGCLLM